MIFLLKAKRLSLNLQLFLCIPGILAPEAQPLSPKQIIREFLARRSGTLQSQFGSLRIGISQIGKSARSLRISEFCYFFQIRDVPLLRPGPVCACQDEKCWLILHVRLENVKVESHKSEKTEILNYPGFRHFSLISRYTTSNCSKLACLLPPLLPTRRSEDLCVGHIL